MEAIQKAKISLVLKDPFYASILMDMNVVYDPTDLPAYLPKTMLVDGRTMYVYTDFAAKLTHKALVWVLKHEALHVALMHCVASRFPVDQYDRRILGHAVDYVVNAILRAEDGDPGIPHLYDAKYVGWTVEQVYRDLLQQQEQEQEQGGGAGEGGMEPGDVMPDNSPGADAEGQVRVAKAVAVAKAMGKELSSGLRDLVDQLLNPKANWKEELDDWCKSASQDDYSFARLNRRFLSRGMKMPAMYNPKGSMRAMAIVLDSSGSIGNEEALRYLSEAAGATNATTPSDLFVAICTSRVVKEFHLTPPFDFGPVIDAMTSGGTDMTAGIDWALELPVEVDGIIVFTDGYTPFGSDPGVPVVWCCTTKGIEAPYGRTLHVEV